MNVENPQRVVDHQTDNGHKVAPVPLMLSRSASRSPAQGASEIKRGAEVAPVPLNMKGPNPALVREGSFIVNAQGGCNDCHTVPRTRLVAIRSSASLKSSTSRATWLVAQTSGPSGRAT